MQAEQLVRRDPLGTVLYGDAAVLSTSTKRVVLESLADLAQHNPWFRSDNWAAQPFGGLGAPGMESHFRRVLQDPASHPILLSCVLDAIRYAQPLLPLSAEVLALARNDRQPTFVRVAALHAFRHLETSPIPHLRTLLDDIHRGALPDADRELRGAILAALYPIHLSPTAVVEYLIAPPPSFVGQYVMFVEHELLARTTDDTLPPLLDALVSRAPLRTARHRLSFRRFLGRALVRGLRVHGTAVATPRLFSWLGIALDKHQTPALDNEPAADIRQWLADRPRIVQSLFQHWLAGTHIASLQLESLYFWRRLHGVTPPAGFGQWLLTLASSEASVERAHFLFREAVRLQTMSERIDAPSLEELYAFVDSRPDFSLTLESEMSWEIPEWRREQAEYQRQHARRQAQKRADNVARLARDIDGIRSGSAFGSLSFLARVWFGLFADVDHALPPEGRLKAETNDEIAVAAVTGFVAALYCPDIPTADAIGNAHTQGREYGFGYVVLAGMDALAAESLETAPALPDPTVAAAIAFHLANPTNAPHLWVNDLADRRPRTVAAALSAFWLPHLARRAVHIPGLHLVEQTGAIGIACCETTLQILRDLPACAEDPLGALLRAALVHSERSATLEVIREVLRSPRTVRGAQRVLWLTAGFVLSPAEFAQKLRTSIRGSKPKVRLTLSLVAGTWPGEQDLYGRLQPSSLASLIRMGGCYFAPPALAEGWLSRDDDIAMGEIVRAMLRRLGQDGSRDATTILASLREDSSLSAWKEPVAHELSIQIRNRRDAEFRYPTTTQVIEAVTGGRPANIRDLRALICNHLREIGEDLRHGSTDGYKAFWNIDSRTRPTTPRPEDDCRDRLLERIRPRLAAVGCLAEPEGHFADDKRADIKALLGPLVMPVEIKRHFNPELWTAPRDQLQKRYSRDPGCNGHGVYLVLWFGVDQKAPPPPPAGIARPVSAAELERALVQMLPIEDRGLTEVVVLDVARNQ